MHFPGGPWRVWTLLLLFLAARTQAGAPFASTQAPQDVTALSADLIGWPNPNNEESSAWFEWGPTTAYGNRTSSTSLPAVFAILTAQYSLTDLAPNTTYHYRLVVSNSSATTLGSDVAFTTSWFANTRAPVPPGIWTSVAFGDFDNDGWLDFIYTGTTNPLVLSGTQTRLLRNIGGTNFENVPTTMPDVQQGSVAWADFNNDGWLDLVHIGRRTNSLGAGALWRNTGTNAVVVHASPIPGPQDGAAAWADIDRDGDLDLLITGEPGPTYQCAVFRNSAGTFANLNLGLLGVQESAIAWGDYDNDGLPDLLVLGNTNATTHGNLSRLYRNLGNGTFTDSGLTLPPLHAGAVAWGDYNNDGWLDFVISGATVTNSGLVTRIYRNNRDGTFTDIQAGLPLLYQSTAAWGDMDNDGWLDLVLTGSGTNSFHGDIYLNSGGTFSNKMNAGLPRVQAGSLALGDIDNDGRLDVLLTGQGQSTYLGRLYQNLFPVTNTAPTEPTNLLSFVSPDARSVMLSWSPGSDAQTPVTGLTYNVRLGTSPGGIELISPQSDLATGRRRLPAMGNAQHRLWLVVTNLVPGTTYYWSVQSVDTAWAGSPFAAEHKFTAVAPPRIVRVQPLPERTMQVTVSGTANAPARIQATSLLTQPPQAIAWTTLTNLALPASGSFQFQDLSASNSPVRFYRVVSEQD